MPYATQSDLEERFGPQELAQLTDRVDGLMPDPAVVARAIADAEAEIDGYLAARYAVPLGTVPAVLVRLTCDIARYRLYDDRVTEAVRTRYTDAIAFLRAVAKGDARIEGETALAATANGNEASVSEPSRPLAWRYR